MLPESDNQQNQPLTPEQLRALDPEFWTDERIEQQMKQWSYQFPSDPNKLLAHAKRASDYEYEMRGLNYDLHKGRITEEEYQQLAEQANQRHFGEDN
jgi:hypothetical protein